MSNCKSCSKYKKNEYTGFSICTGESYEIQLKTGIIDERKRKFSFIENNIAEPNTKY